MPDYPAQVESTNAPNPIVAIHSRIGRDPPPNSEENGRTDEYEDEEDEPSYFSPRRFVFYTTNEEGMGAVDSNVLPQAGFSKSLACRHWSMVAQATGNVIQLFAIPLGWKDNSNTSHEGNHLDTLDDDEFFDDDDDDDDENGEDNPSGSRLSNSIAFYLTTKLTLSVESERQCEIRDVSFYGDNGKSSLSSGMDRGTGKESRQKLALLLSTKSDEQEDGEQLELWLLSYDTVMWQVIPVSTDQSQQSKMSLISFDQLDDGQYALIVEPLPLKQQDEERQQGVDDDQMETGTEKVFAKSTFNCQFCICVCES